MKRAAAAIGIAVLFGGLVYLVGAVPLTMAAIFGAACGLIVYVGDRKK